MDVSADMSARLAELSRALEHVDLNETLRHVANACATMIPGTSGASVTLWRKDGPYTFAASTAAVDAVDTVQYELMSGPCVDAARVHKALIIKDMSREPRWPEFSRAALDCGIHSSLSLPLVVGPKVLGSLNL